MPNMTSSTEFCGRISQNGVPESLRSRSRENAQTSTSVSVAQPTCMNALFTWDARFRGHSGDGTSTAGTIESKSKHGAEQRASEVILGPRRGFSILPSGSLNHPPVKGGTMERQKSSASNVSAGSCWFTMVERFYREKSEDTSEEDKIESGIFD